jgi:hypothetical protein
MRTSVSPWCEVVGHLKEFKVCPRCKTARYCGDACQKQDWNAGGHKDKCGTFMDDRGKDEFLSFGGDEEEDSEEGGSEQETDEGDSEQESEEGDSASESADQA